MSLGRSVPEPDFGAVVVAAGASRRFGAERPKQFHDLAGRSVLRRSVEAMAGAHRMLGVVVVLPAGELEGRLAAEARGWPGVLRLVAGGATRADSVRSGLRAVPPVPYVLVHDAARPLVPARVVGAVQAATREHGAAIPGIRVTDTVKRLDSDGCVGQTLDRDALLLAQTPQGARCDWLVEALDRARREGFEATDEAAALEHAGHRVMSVGGDADNVKITEAEDLGRARRRLDPGHDSLRVGTGFDIHRVDSGRRLVLGGVDFDDESGLSGHSDADVILHAAMDAVLGAAGLGDIGTLFPPEDPEYAGADSTVLARTVVQRVAEAGFELVNLDLTLLAERPRIRERVEELRESIASCFQVERSRVGVKATTLERLGALGRGEGMACQSVAMVRRV